MDEHQLAMNLSVTLAGIFLFAALMKLARGTSAQHALIKSIGFPSGLAVRLFVRTLPVVEMSLSIWLLTGWRPDHALVAAALALLAFAVILVLALQRGYSGSCGCFWSDKDQLGIANVFFDLLLLLVAVCSLVLQSNSESAAAKLVMYIGAMDLMVIVVAGGWLVALNVIAREIERVHRSLASLRRHG